MAQKLPMAVQVKEGIWALVGMEAGKANGMKRLVFREGLFGCPLKQRQMGHREAGWVGQCPALEGRSPEFESASVSDLLCDVSSFCLDLINCIR